jgi:hypothetical protein
MSEDDDQCFYRSKLATEIIKDKKQETSVHLVEEVHT